jgi:glucose-1-phosphate cytidylyltransferase
LDIDKETKAIKAFREKSTNDGSRVNAGFMVLQPEIFDYIDGDDTIFEKGPLERLATKEDLCAYKHNGFWKCMDTKREMDELEQMWQTGRAPWKIW